MPAAENRLKIEVEIETEKSDITGNEKNRLRFGFYGLITAATGHGR